GATPRNLSVPTDRSLKANGSIPKGWSAAAGGNQTVVGHRAAAAGDLNRHSKPRNYPRRRLAISRRGACLAFDASNDGWALPRETSVMEYQSLLTVLVVCCLVPRAVDAADGVFDSNGVKIRYVTEGKGEPVVLIHGWMGDSSMWGRDSSGNTQLKAADGFQVIALDCRGHGKSDKPHDPTQYGPEMAADVVRLLDHLKIEKAHLIGYSMG